MLAGDNNLPRAAAASPRDGPEGPGRSSTANTAPPSSSAKDEFAGGTHPFRAPALPIDEVVDPTGAGDSFAGGFMGYIASQPASHPRVSQSRRCSIGGVMGSFAVERFGTERLQQLTREEIDARYALFREMTHLD